MLLFAKTFIKLCTIITKLAIQVNHQFSIPDYNWHEFAAKPHIWGVIRSN
jgi:hypothetical protein